ncbi:MAG: HIG1 domain-containing protein [Rhodospirillales bacterium]|nr:HIG1 domain-containing protein [Rhodospirillales bacterium]
MLGFLFGIAAFATVIVLMIGVVSFAVHGPFYKKHANHLMRLRVLFQGLAILCLGLSVWIFAS